MHEIPDPASQRGGTTARAFLLRCWREVGAGKQGEPVWRFSVTEAEGDRRRWGCASREGLLRLLRQRLGEEGG